MEDDDIDLFGTEQSPPWHERTQSSDDVGDLNGGDLSGLFDTNLADTSTVEREAAEVYQEVVEGRRWKLTGSTTPTAAEEPAQKGYDVVGHLIEDIDRDILTATDCAGLDCPNFAHQSWSRVCEANGKRCTFRQKFASESERNAAALAFHSANHKDNEVMYIDLTKRTEQGGPYRWKKDDVVESSPGIAALPGKGELDIYDAGSDCKNFSHRNTSTRATEPLSWASLLKGDDEIDLSTKLLMYSLWTGHLKPNPSRNRTTWEAPEIEPRIVWRHRKPICCSYFFDL